MLCETDFVMTHISIVLGETHPQLRMCVPVSIQKRWWSTTLSGEVIPGSDPRYKAAVKNRFGNKMQRYRNEDTWIRYMAIRIITTSCFVPLRYKKWDEQALDLGDY